MHDELMLHLYDIIVLGILEEEKGRKKEAKKRKQKRRGGR